MRFDAYQGNVWEGRFDQVAELIAHNVGGRVERGRPRGRYGIVLDVLDGASPVGWVADDGVNSTAYFEFKGERSPDVAEALRRHLEPGAHNVSRADVCDDFYEPGAFSRLVDLIDRTKQDPRVNSEAIVPRDGDRGQTVYWGSRTSAIRVRCYEKGKQKENLYLQRPNWARVEAQFRPSKSSQKALAATLNPVEFWGLGRWTKNVAEALLEIDIQRFAPPQSKPEYDKTTLYLATTFRRHFEEMLADFGDWQCIGREFQQIWDSLDNPNAEE